MNTNRVSLILQLSDHELVARVKHTTRLDCETTAELVAELGEIDARKLYRDEGCSSFFSFCTEMLHMSESMAWLRIQAARAARKFPVILDRLAAGQLMMWSGRLVRPPASMSNPNLLAMRALSR